MTEFTKIMRQFEEAGLFNGIRGCMLANNQVISVNNFIPKHAYKPFHQKQCFANAVKLLERITGRNDVWYCEGYVSYNNEVPIEHAWVMVGDSIVDPTFEICLKEDLQKMNNEQYYLLKRYTLKEVYNEMYTHKAYGPWWNKKWRDVA